MESDLKQAALQLREWRCETLVWSCLALALLAPAFADQPSAAQAASPAALRRLRAKRDHHQNQPACGPGPCELLRRRPFLAPGPKPPALCSRVSQRSPEKRLGEPVIPGQRRVPSASRPDPHLEFRPCQGPAPGPADAPAPVVQNVSGQRPACPGDGLPQLFHGSRN